MDTNALKAWIESEGHGALSRLHKAIQAELPTFTLSLLSNYVSGEKTSEGTVQRIMPFQVAKIISRHTGIPLSKLQFKYIHRPAKDTRSHGSVSGAPVSRKN